MSPHILDMPHILAQIDSSDTSDFLSQISGLLALTCVAGILWLILMALVMQRATERRRREKLGLEPLPGIHVTAYRWLMRLVNPESPQTTPAPPRVSKPDQHLPPPSSSSAESMSMPAPDLALLTGDLPEPEVDDLAETFPEPPPDEIADLGETTYEDEARLEEKFPPESSEDDRVTDDAAAAEMPYDDLPPGEQPPDSVELLRVWRDLSDGSLIVEIGGRRFETLGELRSADLERRFLSVVRDLDAMTRLMRDRPARTLPVPTDDSTPGGESDTAPASMSPGSMLRQMTRVAMGQAPEPVEHTAPLSIADQIEDLLQARLADMPSYSQRTIHVRPSIEGGVRIEVDGTFYEGVDEIDDLDVRELLQDVVREWEESQ